MKFLSIIVLAAFAAVPHRVTAAAINTHSPSASHTTVSHHTDIVSVSHTTTSSRSSTATPAFTWDYPQGPFEPTPSSFTTTRTIR